MRLSIRLDHHIIFRDSCLRRYQLTILQNAKRCLCRSTGPALSYSRERLVDSPAELLGRETHVVLLLSWVLDIHRLDVTREKEHGRVSWVEGRAVLDEFWLVVGVLQVHLVQQSGGGKVQ